MYCSHCGKELAPHMRFCPQCGQKTIYSQDSGISPKPDTLSIPPNIIQPEQFIIMDHLITPSNDRILYNQLRCRFIKLAESCTDQFKTLYSNNRSLHDIIINYPQQALQSLQPALNECIGYLISHSVYTIDVDTFYSRYIAPTEQWSEPHQALSDQYAEIVLTKEQQDIYRRNRRENRGRWVGGGLGVQGAIKGAVTAGAMNMVAGAGHALFNGISGAIASIATSNKLDQIFKANNTYESLSLGIYNTVFSMHIALTKCIYDQLQDSHLLNGGVPEEHVQSASAILNNVNRIENDKQKQDALVTALNYNPYAEEWYTVVLEQYGDVNGELERMANYFGITAISRYKDNALMELYKSFTISTELDALKAKQRLLDLKKELHYSGASQVIDEIDAMLNKFDSEARTVDGMLFSNREEAEQNRLEFNSFIADYRDLDKSNIKSLQSFYNKLQSYSGTVANKYKTEISELLNKLELKSRSVYFPKEYNQYIVFDTAEEASSAREYLNDLFSALKQKPLGAYNELYFYMSLTKAIINDPRSNSIPKITCAFIEILESFAEDVHHHIKQRLSLSTIYYNELQNASKEIIHLKGVEHNRYFPRVLNNIQNSYLKQLGFKSDEEILMIYDNTIFHSGDKGFTITNRGFYSSGNILEKPFFIPRDDIDLYDIHISGSDLIINHKTIDIIQTAWLTRNKVKDIVCCLLSSYPAYDNNYDVTIPHSTK